MFVKHLIKPINITAAASSRTLNVKFTMSD